MSKFADLVKEWAVSPEDIVKASNVSEARSSADRELSTKRRQVRNAGKKITEEGVKKPKLGRALTLKSVQIAMNGTEQPRLVRGKLVRALNQLAKMKKKTALTAIDLFGEVKTKRGKPPAKKTGK